MTTANYNKLAAASVAADDELQNAIAAAYARAEKVYAHGRNTLVDQIPIEKWVEWDATEDLAIVADSDGLEGEEDGCLDAAA